MEQRTSLMLAEARQALKTPRMAAIAGIIYWL
jgi:hypothetical protein